MLSRRILFSRQPERGSLNRKASLDQRFLGHLFNGVYEQLLPYPLKDLGFEVLVGETDQRGRVQRPVVRERTIFGHVEARRVTTFDFLLARGDDVFLVEATGWQTAQGIAPCFDARTLRSLEGRPGTETVRRLAHLDLRRHECLVNRQASPRQPTAKMLLWWDVELSDAATPWPGEPFRTFGRGRQGLVVGSIRILFERYFGSSAGGRARAALHRYRDLSATFWDGLDRGDLSALESGAEAGAA